MTKGLIAGTLGLIAFSCMHSVAQDKGNVAVQLVDTLTELAQGPHKGFRSNHAKGVVVTGSFTPTAYKDHAV